MEASLDEVRDHSHVAERFLHHAHEVRLRLVRDAVEVWGYHLPGDIIG